MYTTHMYAYIKHMFRRGVVLVVAKCVYVYVCVYIYIYIYIYIYMWVLSIICCL